MFGFLRPQQRIPAWRRSYARICQVQRQLFGLTSLPFLSYEATFLYQLAIDRGLIPPLPNEAPECCRLRKLRRADLVAEEAPAVYVAAFGMLLAGVKLQDDVNDSGRWYNRWLNWKYRRPVQRAKELLAAMSPQIPTRVTDAIAAHSCLERQSQKVSLAEYARPTGDGFAAVFEGFLSCIETQAGTGVQRHFSDIGRCVGEAIITWDCAVDYDRDGVTGEFNPLRDTSEVRESLTACLLRLAMIAWETPIDSTCRRVVADVTERVRRRRDQRLVTHPIRRLERWGLIRQRGFAYARCDGCDALCAVGECCECIGGAGEATAGLGGECCAGTSACNAPCCCEGLICCDACAPTKASKKQNETSEQPAARGASPYAEYVEREGVTSGDLNPAGYVLIDGDKIPAKTRSGRYLADGTRVHIVRADPFGVTVTPAQ
ncbi:MAG: DUF5685 family protein [Fuerstiella sp.]